MMAGKEPLPWEADAVAAFACIGNEDAKLLISSLLKCAPTYIDKIAPKHAMH